MMCGLQCAPLTLAISLSHWLPNKPEGSGRGCHALKWKRKPSGTCGNTRLISASAASRMS
eukprot:514647-Rhodomonas_salina.1